MDMRRRMLLIAGLALAGEARAESAAPGVDALMGLVEEHYYRKLSDEEKEALRRGAAEGLIEALERLQKKKLGVVARSWPPGGHGEAPGSLKVNEYLDPDEARLLQQETSGTFGGVGIVIERKVVDPAAEKPVQRLMVKDFVEKSAAQEAGVQKGDAIVAVDGHATGELELAEAVRMLRGLEGQPVVIRVDRGGTEQEVTVVRKKVEWDPCEHVLLESDIGYISIKVFNENTAASVERRLKELAAKKIAGLVIDLRHCPGGRLDSGLATIDHFLAEGKMVGWLEKGDDQPKEEFKDKGPPLWEGPIALLVGPGTASSAELFTLSLRDTLQAMLLGDRTHGKGTAEKLVELPAGAMLRITSSIFYGPAGTTPATGGIEPDVKLAPARVSAGTENPDQEEPVPPANDPWVESARRLLLFKNRK